MTPTHIEGLLFDMDGVLTVSWRPLPGAVAAFARVRATGLPLRVVTNTTGRSRPRMGESLRAAGFDIADEHVMTTPVAAAAYLGERHPGARVFLLGDAQAEDLRGVRLVGIDEGPEIILVSGADDSYTFAAFNRVLRALHRGARLVAMHRNLVWMTTDGENLDAGAYLAGLELAAGVEAVVLGKPAPGAFLSAVRDLGLPPERVAMIGDDVRGDVLAAQAVGITGVLVRTGKFRPEALARAGGAPDHVIDSVADLPDLLGL